MMSSSISYWMHSSSERVRKRTVQDTPNPNPRNALQFLHIFGTDSDGDSKKDILLAGNNYHPEVETTRSDAGISTFLKGNGKGKYEFISNAETGLFLDEDIRDLEVVDVGNQILFPVFQA